ncbi:MAG: hypothetical protein H0U76_00770 [Ktedonobacteraceae bacterium]|nr:hypothetical protein [Ktedonobacteraceae bacterium]
MSHPSSTPEESFATIVEELLGYPDVTPPSDGKRFGSSALKIHGKIFAMLSGGKLVVKLPRSRVEQLVASGDGEPFDPKKNGQLMKEWICIGPKCVGEWLDLSKEAMNFVVSKR